MSLKFVGLHAHSLSLGDSIGFPKDHFDFVIKNAESDSMSLAISDHGNANSFGYIFQAQNEYKKKGINFKPIFGQELYIHPDLDEWKKLKQQKEEEKEEEQEAVLENESESKNKWFDPIKRRHHLVILAKNDIGLKNLFKLTSWSYRKGFYRFPRVDFKMLDECKEGLIISTACIAGLPSWLIFREEKNGDQAIQNALDNEFKPLFDIFGRENSNIEIQFNRLKEQMLVNKHLIKFTQRHNYNIIAAADSHYPDPKLWKDRELYRLLARQSRGYEFDKSELPQSIEELDCELYPKSGDQMFDAYLDMMKNCPDDRYDEVAKRAIEHTFDIAHNQIEKIQPNGSMKLPRSIVPKESTAIDEIKKICISRLKELKLDQNKEYIDRLINELKIIKSKDFALYFLTLYEAFAALRQEMLLGPARGSGAGSLVCYLLQITQLDPIKKQLLFERFLSENRKEFPDIDNDVEDREKCLEVLQKKFGKDNVISVTNFNTLQLKSLIKDISKFYDIPYQEVNETTLKIEDEAKPFILEDIGHDQKLYSFTFEGAKKYSPTFNQFLEKYPHVGTHIENLFKQIKSYGRHAGGMVILENSDEVMPIIRVKSIDQTPWTEGMQARHLEQFGLVKYDFLGLATLRVIRKCIELILKKQGNKNPSMSDINAFYAKTLTPEIINPADQKIFEHVYHNGNFPGIFQFTERNVQNFAKRAKPECVEDIAVITSVWRPGPLKSGADKRYVDPPTEFNHPILKQILGPTRGILAYQEQFMLLANRLAGFSLVEADELRKLLVKPVTSLGEELKIKRLEAGEKFIKGCVEKGLTKDAATHLWEDEILGFISYGFNKSHAVAYAYISYQCAHLFTYHEKEWICAYLQEDADSENAIKEAQSLGYIIGKPDINLSSKEWSLQDKTLTPSFLSIKAIGEAGVEEVMALRPFKSIDDLLFATELKTWKSKPPEERRVLRLSKFNKRMLSAMIYSEGFGSLNCVGPGLLFENYRHMHLALIENWDEAKKGKWSVEELAALVKDRRDFTTKEKIDSQVKLLGSFDRGLLLGQETLDFFKDHDIFDLTAVAEYDQNIWFCIESIEKKYTKAKKQYYSFQISDLCDKRHRLNYFDVPKITFEPNRIYVAQLRMKDSWLNLAKWGEIIKL